MCNAFNHPPECRCGWGGEGHLGRRGPGTGFSQPIRRTWETAESYMRPNGRCPKCGQAVFISRSPDGRQILLDELGPPWPVHVCPIAKREPSPPVPSRRYAWQESGWTPFIVAVITSVSPELIRIGGTAAGKMFDVYLEKARFGSYGDLREEIQRSAVHVRPRSEERFIVSALLPPARVVVVDAYSSSIEAFDAAVKGRSTRGGSRSHKGVRRTNRA